MLRAKGFREKKHGILFRLLAKRGFFAYNAALSSFPSWGVKMAVQQNKKSVAKRGNHRAHDFLTNPPTAVEATTGEVHRRHHISPTGYYRGKKVIATKNDAE